MHYTKTGNIARTLTATFIAFSITSASAEPEILMIADFTDGVLFDRFALQPNTWTPAQVNNGSEATAFTYNGNAVMKVTDPGGSNGLYAIFPGVVPASGDYTLRCTAKFYEFNTAFVYEPFRSYMIGVTVNGSHRAGSGTLATPGTYSAPITSHFTSGDDSAKPPITLQTPVFTAAENDSLCISLATYHTFSLTYSNGNWNNSYILIDNIELVPYPEPTTPVSLSGWELE